MTAQPPAGSAGGEVHEAGPAGPALIRVVPLGQIDQVAVAVVAANLQALLDLTAEIAPAQPLPEQARLKARDQYDASLIIKALRSDSTGPERPPPLVIGLIPSDLCLPLLTYVLGEAELGGRAAVVSLFRLAGPGPDQTPRHLVYERLVKVALHETGHLLGLTHCRVPVCLMNFSPSASRLDELSLELCPVCRRLARRGRARLRA